MRFWRYIAILMAALVLPLSAYGQKSRKPADRKSDRDSLVRLISADSLQLLEIRGVSYRKVVGNPARFFHNNTYLLCDTALWNVDDGVINAMGKVKIMQDRTVLSSDRLDYYVDRDLAEFRGTLVQLTDKDKNTLRTHYLDYNTKDSIAVFRNGASMRDKDGQIIESLSGTYDSKIQTFVFTEDVNMYTDSVFVKTTYLKYESDLSLATFGFNTHAWKDDNMLSANAGTYDRSREKFFFRSNVHVMSDTQEGWSDSLYFNRATMDVLMLGNAQVTDTTRNVSALAGSIDYVDSISTVTLTRFPAIVAEIEDQEKPGGVDSVWFGADTMVYWTVKRYMVDSLEVVEAEQRLKSVETDPVSALRKEAAEAAAKAAAEAAENDPNNAANAAKRQEEYEKSHGKPSSGGGSKPGGPVKPPRVTDLASKMSPPMESTDSTMESSDSVIGDAPVVIPAPDSLLTTSSDSLALSVSSDSLALSVLDSLEVNPPADVLEHPSETPSSETPSSKTPSSGSQSKRKMSREGFSLDASATKSVVADEASVEDPSEELSDEEGPSEAKELSDTVATIQLDTTKIGFVRARGKVKIYRESMQVLCDSLRYSDLDSLARLYKEPKIWNEVTHQYIADSIYVVVSNGAMEKANLLSNAFIHIQEDTLHYDQIRSAEMTAYFDDEGQLSRFDALGGASALFYVEENDALATVNKKDCKMLSAEFENGGINRVFYFQEAKSDAYPVVQMSKDDQIIKGFAWTPEQRPTSRYDITRLSLRPGQRSRYEAVPQGQFIQTEVYFPGYMKEVHRQLEIQDSLKTVRARERQLAKQRAEEKARLDALRADSLAVADSLAIQLDSLSSETADSLGMSSPLDSLSNVSDPLPGQLDTLSTAPDSLAIAAPLTPEEEAAAAKAAREAARAAEKAAAKAAKDAQRQERKEAAELRKSLRIAALDAKWEEKDRQDSLKQAAKAEKSAAKLRRKKAKALEAQLRQEAKEQMLLEKYIERYEKRRNRRQSAL